MPKLPNVSFMENDELTVKPLTAAEIAWINKAGLLFAAMPKRLQLMEGGDSVSVVDREGAKSSNCAYGAASVDGIVLAQLHAAMFKIFGVSA